MEWIKLSERHPEDFEQSRYRSIGEKKQLFPRYEDGGISHFVYENGNSILLDDVEWRPKGVEFTLGKGVGRTNVQAKDVLPLRLWHPLSSDENQLSKRLQVALGLVPLVKDNWHFHATEIVDGSENQWAKELLTLADVLIKADSEL